MTSKPSVPPVEVEPDIDGMAAERDEHRAANRRLAEERKQLDESFSAAEVTKREVFRRSGPHTNAEQQAWNMEAAQRIRRHEQAVRVIEARQGEHSAAAQRLDREIDEAHLRNARRRQLDERAAGAGDVAALSVEVERLQAEYDDAVADLEAIPRRRAQAFGDGDVAGVRAAQDDAISAPVAVAVLRKSLLEAQIGLAAARVAEAATRSAELEAAVAAAQVKLDAARAVHQSAAQALQVNQFSISDGENDLRALRRELSSHLARHQVRVS